jgi:hypothetical protein
MQIAHPHFPLAEQVPFAHFNNRCAGGSCYVVGRGPTEFDYTELGATDEPVFFINDAVCLEKHVRGESFFFAHDRQLLPWLNGAIRSTAVLPIDGKVFCVEPGEAPERTLAHAGKIVFYHWREDNRQAQLHMTRDQLAEAKQLFTHTGTIHSLLHFVWYCGFRKVSFVGCDCITDTHALAGNFHTPDGYDPRLENRSGSSASPSYPAIRRAQDLLTMLFGFEAVYRGTPRPISDPTPSVPQSKST